MKKYRILDGISWIRCKIRSYLKSIHKIRHEFDWFFSSKKSLKNSCSNNLEFYSRRLTQRQIDKFNEKKNSVKKSMNIFFWAVLPTSGIDWHFLDINILAKSLFQLLLIFKIKFLIHSGIKFQRSTILKTSEIIPYIPFHKIPGFHCVL